MLPERFPRVGANVRATKATAKRHWLPWLFLLWWLVAHFIATQMDYVG